MKLPLDNIISEAKELFAIRYGYQAEAIYASVLMARVITKWAEKQGFKFGRDLEIGGLPVYHMTKYVPAFVFYMTATRDGLVYSQKVTLEPEQVNQIGGKVVEHKPLIIT